MSFIHVSVTPLTICCSRNWRHFGCSDDKMIASMKVSYGEPSEIEGFSQLKPAEQEKVQRAWDADEVLVEDKGPGEAVENGKKAPVKRKKKDDDGEDAKPKRTRVKKAKVSRLITMLP